ncbi:MAG: hypothetical protein Q8P95_02375, partial [bacterium]|nr:hypothetical protein [bacterium]
SQINAGATVEQTTNRFDTNVLDIFGTFNGSPLGINDLTVAGNITIRNGGTLVAPTAGITLFGNWSLENGGTFTPGVATVFLNNNNDQEFFGSTTFLNLFKGQGGPTTLTFPAGETQTITGTLVLGGENGNPITLTSSGPGTAALNAPGTVNLSFLNIQGIVAQPTLSCTTGCVDGGGNTNWIFTTPSSGSSSGRSMRRLSSPTIRAHISEAPMAVAESSQGRAASWEILPLPAESTTHAAAQEEAETQTLTNHPVPNPQTFTTPLLLVSQVIDLNHIPLALKKMYADTWYQEAGALFMYVQLQVVKSFFPDINPDILMGPDPLAAIPLRTFLEYLLTPSNQPVFLADSELLEQGQGFQLLPSTIRIDHFDQPIRRSQALVMTNRFIAHLSGVDLEEAMAKIEPANKYNDIPTDSPLVHHALFSALIGIFSGLNSDTFEPDRDLNYAEFFALLKNINTYLSARQ